MQLHRLSFVMLVLLGGPALAATAAPCGSTVTIQRNDTLSSIASRCDVSEASLLNANPAVQGSSDLQVGATLHIDAGSDTGGNVGATVRSFSRKAGNTVGTLANDVGSSVQDLLDKNPDLKARLDKVGSTVGLTSDQPPATATVTTKNGSPGTTVTVTANGLQPNSPISIGAGAPGAAYSVIGHAQSTASGTVESKVTIPNDVTSGQDIVFSIATGAGVAARTGRFAVK